MSSLSKHSHEEIVASLNDEQTLKEYELSCDGLKIHWLPQILGSLLVFSGNVVFGERPSYGKFKAVEVIARIPYQSWEVASYMFLTMFYANEKKAIELTHTSHFGRAAQDNETMHVIVMSQLAKKYGQDSIFRHTLIPLVFSFFYFIGSFVLYIIKPRYSFELNYLFESHAFEQYSRFTNENEVDLRSKAVMIDFLEYYGRFPKSEYELFVSIRNDELIHRSASAKEVVKHEKKDM
jgi:ubiquinol oxidase